MYHFMATCAPEPLELSESVHIPGHIRQYLRDFQVETLHFLHKHLANRDFCILNDESGLGKCVSTAVYLGAIAKNQRTLIVVQNDDELVTGWQFHFEVLTNLSVGVLAANTSSLDPLPNIIIAKWATLRTNNDISKYNFDYIIVDNRGEMMNNNFCMSMLLSNYENKVNLILSSADVAAELKLLHNCLRLGGHLEQQYEQFKNFEAKYKLPSSKDVLNKTADLEQYFLKREMISDYCKDFRLRRYRYQQEDQLPLVDVERYQISLELWRTVSSSNSSQRSNENANNLNANSETATEELFNQALALDREVTQIIQSRQGLCPNLESNETSEEVMSPLLIDSESCSSDVAEVVNITNGEEAIFSQKQQSEPDIYEFVDLSGDQNSNEYVSTANEISKTNECQTKLRSPIHITNNQKTAVQNHAEKSVNVIDLAAESQFSVQKTNVASLRVAAAKKTKQQSVECKEKVSNSTAETNTPSSLNQDQSTAKKQTQSASKKQNAPSSECMPITAQTVTNKKETGIVTRRRRVINKIEKVVEETRKTRKTGNKAVTASKIKDLAKEKTGIILKKRKSGDIDATSNNVSPAKRSSLNKVEATEKDTMNEKANNDNKKDVKNKERSIQPKDEVQRSPRQSRQLKDDKSVEKLVDKSTTSPEKSTRDTTITTPTPTKNALKSERAKDNNTSTNSTSNSTEKRKQKDSPKSKQRPGVPETPTSRSTRSMQSMLTRSADNTKSKYMRASLTLDDSRKQKKRKARASGKQDEEDGSKALKAEATTSLRTTTERQHAKESTSSSSTARTMERKNSKVNKKELESSAVDEKEGKQRHIATPNKTNSSEKGKETMLAKDVSLLPCTQYTEDMQCGQKIISSDTHSDNGFLRPPTPVRFMRNSEHKNFLSTPSSITDSEVEYIAAVTNKTQPVVVLTSSTDDGSHSSQQSVQSRRTRALKQKKTVKRSVAEPANAQTTATPTFGELLAQQRIQRKSPEIFSASTDLGLTCTQQRAASGVHVADTDTFQGFKIFGSEVKQMQQQHAKQQQSGEKRATQTFSRGRSCLNILDIMFEPSAGRDGTDADDAPTQSKTNKSKHQQSTKQNPDAKLVKRKSTKVSQPVVPILPNLNKTTQVQLQQAQAKQGAKSTPQQPNNITKNPLIPAGSMVDEEIFEITNNDAFGSVMRINSNGEISPVQTTQIHKQQTQHNKITNYLIGSSSVTQLTPTTNEVTIEERTPNKRTTQVPLLSGTVTRRSPKNKLTQTTKLTKWFQKNDATANDNPTIAEQHEIRLGKQTRSSLAKRLKRRCLELSFKN